MADEILDTEPSVRDAIEAAIDGGAAPDAPAPAAPAPEPLDTSAPAAVPPATEPPVAKSAPAQRNLFAPDAPKFGQDPKAAAPQAPVAPAPELKAPASWKADLRERWKTLPPEVQGEVIRREREHEGRMQEHAQTKRFADQFNRVAEPYRAFIEAEGADPLAAFHDYLKTATMLRMGAPADKARMVANLVQQYGIPLQALDAYLAQAIQQGPVAYQQQYQLQQPGHMVQPQEFRDPRVDAMLAQAEEQQRMGLTQDIQHFKQDPANEFFEDVRDTMADVLDAAAKRGVVLSLPEAYARACQIEPEVKKTLDQRNARGNVTDAARRLAAARHASSSLPSQSAAPAPRSASHAQPGSVRDAIVGAIDQLTTAA